MSTYDAVRANEDHARALAPRMRAADAAEVWASAHLFPLGALLKSLELTPEPVAALVNGEVACMFGVAPLTATSRVGFPWLLTSDLVQEHRKVFLPATKRWVAHVMQDYDHLLNFVDARNIIAMRWLGWLGFEIMPAEPYGIEGLPFHLFEMRN